MKRDLYRKYSVGERLILYSFPPPFFDFLFQGPCKYYKCVTISIFFLELGRIKCAPPLFFGSLHAMS